MQLFNSLMFRSTGSRILRAPLFVAIGLCLLAPAAGSARSEKFDREQILVKARAGVPEEALHAVFHAHGARQVGKITGINVRLLKASPDRLDSVLNKLQRHQLVQFAEKDAIAKATFLPNDPYFTSGYQWHLSKIQAPAAWNVTSGTSTLKVAVLDTGIQSSHPDLQGRIAGGYNFISNTFNPLDDNGHGTAVAGVTAASGNNGLGVAGVSFNCSILPVKVLDSAGYGSYSMIANGITYAADQGARIINLSLAGDSSSSTLQAAVDYAWQRNCVIIAAAGNKGSSLPQYPAACNNVVAVSALQSDDTLASFSSHGSFLDVSAPGRSIWTTQSSSTSQYGAWSGTSFACPVVSGVAALVCSVNTLLANSEVVSILKSTADDLGTSGYDSYTGSGRVNASRALAAAGSSTVIPAPDTTAPSVSVTSPIHGTIVSGTVSIQANATDNLGVTRVELFVDNQLLRQSSSSSTVSTWDTRSHANGSHSINAKAYDAAGNIGLSSTVTVLVNNTVPVLDTTPPSVLITSPANGSALSKTAKITVQAADNVALSRVDLHIDGRRYATSTTALTVFNWNTSKASRGWHTLQAFAYDSSMNVTGSQIISVWK